jgi:hypothetical protein
MAGSKSSSPSRQLPVPILLTAAGSAAALGAYAYLGTFARQIADDYCSVNLISGNFLANLWVNYQTISDRFANFILISLSEAVWPRSVAILPAILLIAWVCGLAWLAHEAGLLAGGRRNLRFVWTLSLLLVFFVVLLAPNRYQTLYWRASSAAHLAPLVLMPYLAAWLARLIRSSAHGQVSPWIHPLTFLGAFFVGDFSEPGDAVQIVLLGAAIASVWIWGRGPSRHRSLLLLAWAFGGAVSAMLVMALSPANSLRLNSAPPPLPIVAVRSFQYALQFTVDQFSVRPLPVLLAVLTPMVLVFYTYAPVSHGRSLLAARRAVAWLAAVAALAYVLIAASFSPSVFGQGFPLERARIAGLFILVATLMFEGAGAAMLLARHPWLMARRAQAQVIAAVLLTVLSLYPIRAAWLALAEAPEYRARTAAWDQREALIQKLKAGGETDLMIPQFDGLQGIKELDVDPNHWTNRCAASYYRVNSIRAIPPDGP